MAQRIALLVNPSEPEGWFERLKTAPHVDTLSKAPPRTVKSGACQQVVRIGNDVDLAEPPVEAGPICTLLGLYSRALHCKRPAR